MEVLKKNVCTNDELPNEVSTKNEEKLLQLQKENEERILKIEEK